LPRAPFSRWRASSQTGVEKSPMSMRGAAFGDDILLLAVAIAICLKRAARMRAREVNPWLQSTKRNSIYRGGRHLEPARKKERVPLEPAALKIGLQVLATFTLSLPAGRLQAWSQPEKQTAVHEECCRPALASVNPEGIMTLHTWGKLQVRAKVWTGGWRAWRRTKLAGFCCAHFSSKN